MTHPGEETGASHGGGGLKVPSIMGETDLERRVSKLNNFYTL
jgi:hypothetical protein